VQRYTPVLNQRIRRELRRPNGPGVWRQANSPSSRWRVDRTQSAVWSGKLN
jgi:hypothetical protein